MKSIGKREEIKNSETTCDGNGFQSHLCKALCFPSHEERGFTLTELMVAMMVFTLIAGSVVMLLTKSQTIFRAEQGVSEMDQNARLLMDFLTRDVQQSKENGLGLGPKFRSIYSNNGLDGRTDEITIISSDTETRLPAASLPLIAASERGFSTS